MEGTWRGRSVCVCVCVEGMRGCRGCVLRQAAPASRARPGTASQNGEDGKAASERAAVGCGRALAARQPGTPQIHALHLVHHLPWLPPPPLLMLARRTLHGHPPSIVNRRQLPVASIWPPSVWPAWFGAYKSARTRQNSAGADPMQKCTQMCCARACVPAGAPKCAWAS